MNLRCVECGKVLPPEMLYECDDCGGILEVIHPNGVETDGALQTSMWRYSKKLPVRSPDHIVSLYEGMTPMHRALRMEQSLSGFRGIVYIKDETTNPTGSFKDRLVSVAISRAQELGCNGIICASSGNAGASAAAYAAKVGLKAIIVAPSHTPIEKLTQISGYGATVVLIDGHYSHSYRFAERLAKEFNYVNVTTTYLNPYGTDGLKTVGYELYEQTGGEIPDYVFVPVGSGPLVKGVYQGFQEALRESGDARKGIPKIIAVQAAGCSPIVKAFYSGDMEVTAWDQPATIASGISDPLIGYEKDGTYTLRLIRESGGGAVSVTDHEIRNAMRILAQSEGVLAEPTGACSLAGFIKMQQNHRISQDSKVVCMVTGHGYKDFKVYREMSPVVHQLKSPDDTESIRQLLCLSPE